MAKWDISVQSVCVALLLIYGIAVALRLWFGTCIFGPLVFTDEYSFFDAARKVSQGGGMLFEGLQTYSPCWLYPLILAPFTAGSAEQSYSLSLLLNSFLINTTVFLAYGFAREITSPRRALVAAALVALIPGLGYASTIMAENIFMPVFMLALWMGYRAIINPSARGRVATGLIFGLAFHIKPQGFFLPIVFALTVLIYEAARAKSRSPRGGLTQYFGRVGIHWQTVMGWLIALSPRYIETVCIEKPPNPWSFEAFLGNYYHRGVGVHPLDWGTFAIVLPASLVIFALASGYFPVLALIRETRPATRSQRTDRAFLLTTMTWTAILVVCGFAARHTLIADAEPHIYERYFMVAVPIALVHFCALSPWKSDRTTNWRVNLVGTFALICILATAVIASSVLRHVIAADSPSLNGMLLVWHAKAIHPAIFPGYLAVAGGASVMALWSIFQPPWRPWTTVVLLFTLNFGFYAAQATIIKSFNDPHRLVAEDIRKELPEGHRLFKLHDGLALPTQWYAGFWSPGATLFVSPDGAPWYARVLELGENGRVITTRSIDMDWLLASMQWKFNKPPVKHFGSSALYRVGGHQPLQIDVEQIRRHLKAGASGEAPSIIKPFTVNDYLQQIRVSYISPHIPDVLRPGEKTTITFYIQNNGDVPLPINEIRTAIGYHWTCPEITGNWEPVIWFDGNYVQLETPLLPGQRTWIELDVKAPNESAEKWLLSLVPLMFEHGEHYWIYQGSSHSKWIRVGP